MKNHDFDKEVRQKALQMAETFDMDGMWENVHAEVQKKEKRRPLFLWIFGGVLLLSFTAWQAVSFDMANNENHFLQTAQALEEESEGSTLNSPSVLKENKDRSNSKVGIETKKEQNSLDSKSNASRDEASRSRIADIQGIPKVEKTMNILNHNTRNKLSTEAKLNNLKSGHSSQTLLPQSVGFRGEQTTNDSNQFGLDSPDIVDKIYEEKRSVLRNLSPLSRLLSGLLNGSERKLPMPSLFPLPTIQKLDIANPSFLRVSGGYYQIGKDWESQGNNLAVFESRNSEESPLDGYDLSIGITKYVCSQLGFDIGVRYQHVFHERSAMTSTKVDTTLKGFVVAQQVSAQGVIEERRDVQTKSTRTFQEHTYLHYKTIGLPIGVRYSVQKGKWSIGAILGLEPILKSYRSGTISVDAWRYSIKEDTQDIYRKGFLMNGYAGWNLAYDLNSRYTLDFNLNTILPLQDRYDDNYSIKERNILYGLQAGLKIKL